jgi:hypothetical protein
VQFGERVWNAALALVGTRFRFHGADPGTGLDCAGLVTAAYGAAGYPVAMLPTYRIRGMDVGSVADLLAGLGLERVADAASGDVLLCMVATRQPHLMIAGPKACVHAHAGLRRVVLMPGACPAGERWRPVSAEGQG